MAAPSSPKQKSRFAWCTKLWLPDRRGRASINRRGARSIHAVGRSAGGHTLELRGQFRGGLDQNRRVDPHRDEQGTPLQVFVRELPVGGERARRLTRPSDRRDSLKNGGAPPPLARAARTRHR